MKRLSPKGKMSQEMWLWVARGMDDVNNIISRGKALLNFYDDYAPRVTSIEKEIISWRAHLRYSHYLKCNTNYISTMHGYCLDPSLIDFSEILKEKCLLYWKLAQKTPLQNIRYENVKLLGDDEENIPCFWRWRWASVRCFKYCCKSLNVNIWIECSVLSHECLF